MLLNNGFCVCLFFSCILCIFLCRGNEFPGGSFGEGVKQDLGIEDGGDRKEQHRMRSGTQWRTWQQQLGRAFTANLFPPASNEVNRIYWTLSKPAEQAWRFSTSLMQAIKQEKSFPVGRAREFSSICNQELLGVHSTPNLRYAGAMNPKLFSSFNHSQGWKLGFTVRTRASNASSREPEYWDTPETRSTSGQEGLQAVQIREWDHDEEQQDLTRDRKVRKDGGHLKSGKDDDGVDWGQQHVRLREYETRQRASLSPNPPPQFQKDDVYIPVKACYISRR